VPLGERVGLTCGGELLGRVGPDRLQEPVARLVPVVELNR
jgi:hypothetical protein